MQRRERARIARRTRSWACSSSTLIASVCTSLHSTRASDSPRAHKTTDRDATSTLLARVPLRPHHPTPPQRWHPPRSLSCVHSSAQSYKPSARCLHLPADQPVSSVPELTPLPRPAPSLAHSVNRRTTSRPAARTSSSSISLPPSSLCASLLSSPHVLQEGLALTAKRAPPGPTRLRPRLRVHRPPEGRPTPRARSTRARRRLRSAPPHLPTPPPPPRSVRCSVLSSSLALTEPLC